MFPSHWWEQSLSAFGRNVPDKRKSTARVVSLQAANVCFFLTVLSNIVEFIFWMFSFRSRGPVSRCSHNSSPPQKNVCCHSLPVHHMLSVFSTCSSHMTPPSTCSPVSTFPYRVCSNWLIDTFLSYHLNCFVAAWCLLSRLCPPLTFYLPDS